VVRSLNGTRGCHTATSALYVEGVINVAFVEQVVCTGAFDGLRRVIV